MCAECQQQQQQQHQPVLKIYPKQSSFGRLLNGSPIRSNGFRDATTAPKPRRRCAPFAAIIVSSAWRTDVTGMTTTRGLRNCCGGCGTFVGWAFLFVLLFAGVRAECVKPPSNYRSRGRCLRSTSTRCHDASQIRKRHKNLTVVDRRPCRRSDTCHKYIADVCCNYCRDQLVQWSHGVCAAGTERGERDGGNDGRQGLEYRCSPSDHTSSWTTADFDTIQRPRQLRCAHELFNELSRLSRLRLCRQKRKRKKIKVRWTLQLTSEITKRGRDYGSTHQIRPEALGRWTRVFCVPRLVGDVAKM